MRPAMHHLSIGAIRADALFVSALQCGDHPSAKEVRQAVAAAVEAFGQRGCVERVAQEFGDHPETAVMRMRWARQVVGQAFGELDRHQPVSGRLLGPPELTLAALRKTTAGRVGVPAPARSPDPQPAFDWLTSTRWPSGSRRKQRISLPQSCGGVRNTAPLDRSAS
jgi:hypothetical protein